MLETMADAIGVYATLAAAEGRSPKTIEWVVNGSRLFERFIGPATPLSRITKHDVRRFILALQGRQRWTGHPTIAVGGKLSPVSVNSYVRGLRMLFGALAREELIAENPLAGLRAPKVPRKLVDPFEESELREIFKALKKTRCPYRNTAIALFLLDSGVRIGELIGIGEGDIDLNTRVARVDGKTGPRLVPFGAQAAKAILLYQAKERTDTGGPLFQEQDGRPLTALAVQLMFRRISKELGIRVHAHRFRHSFGVMFLRNGGDSFHVQAVLGHSTPAMTSRYVKLANRDLAQAHRKFSPGDRFRF